MNKSFSRFLRVTAAAAVLSFGAGTVASFAAGPVTVGGAPMYAEKNIIENAVNSKDHTTLVAAVKAAGLVETLSGPGPFTVFAPVNAAFDALPAGTVDSLLKPDMKDTLTKVLTYHVVAGTYSAADLMAKAKDMGGALNLTTVEGDTDHHPNERRRALGLRRDRQGGEDHHRRRQPVERRHPRHRQGFDDEDVTASSRSIFSGLRVGPGGRAVHFGGPLSCLVKYRNAAGLSSRSRKVLLKFAFRSGRRRNNLLQVYRLLISINFSSPPKRITSKKPHPQDAPLPFY